MSVATEPDKRKLPKYKYDQLHEGNDLRLLRLRPSSDDNNDIDAELAEFRFPDHTQGAGNPPVSGNVLKLSYEAVSWCWGREKPDQLLRIHKSDKVYAFHISKNLKSALWALRKNDEVRNLWIDAICIDQKNTKERNEQVPRMDRIYGNAKSVCIWLGEPDDQSKLAMKFIKDQVLSIWAFDKLIENRDMAQQWAAFITLMKRPWFSRRWVVQEIALSPSGGTLYCGKDEVPWQDFADAVSLFVEVESATHRLSDVMKRDEFFGHISDYFGDVSSLGAALLVDATSNLFRNSQTGGRQPLSTLEYLVSHLSVFEASQPRDTIYALLAISKDTTPRNIDQDISVPGTSQARKKVMAWFQKRSLVNLSYNVDYKLPVIDVYKEFIEFSIGKSDKTRALDIICRPWAPNVLKKHDNPEFLLDPSGITSQERDEEDMEVTKNKKDEKDEKDENEKEDTKDYNDKNDKKNDGDDEVPLPSWIPNLSSAAFEMEEHPYLGLRMERQNADPLVGLPGSDQRNYSAAGTKALDVDKLKFMKWTTLQKKDTHYPDYSMFVEGFVLDEVLTVYQIASNGNMPYQWLKPGGWHDTDEKPPDEFWRTLVADRGPNGRNPPTYFPRACRESMKFKAKTKSRMRGNLDSKRFINEGQCTIVAEFLRRVQATIWNRVLIKTVDGRLGLARDDVRPGHKICVLYGCSVPVILQEKAKDKGDAEKEQKILYDEWLQKRERVVKFFQDMWRMRVRRRAQEKAVQEKAAEEKAAQETAAQKTTVPKTPPEPLMVLESSRKPGTWPMKAHQDSNVNKSPLFNDEHSSSETSAIWTLHETEKSDTDELLPDGEITSTYSSALVDQPAPLHGNGSPASSQKEATHGNGGIRTPTIPKDAVHDDVKHKAVPQENAPQQETEKPWRELTLPEKGELGKKKAEAREEYEFKLALTPKYYTLFGECYVHGMMNGEAIARQNDKSAERQMPQQVFELR